MKVWSKTFCALQSLVFKCFGAVGRALYLQ